MSRPALPRGTVTFLFSDIEGSTRLLKELGGGYAQLLAEHQRILRAAFAAHGGQEVDTQGDSFFVAFQTAKDAVAAAVDGQRDLEAQEWPGGVRVRVRMGLHTGEPRVGGERYVGIGVHKAARIGSAGHGGQVLLSSTTKELAEEDLPPGVAIRGLGERRLKDLDQPQRLYQLVIEGLPSEFAQLRTLDVELRRKRRRIYTDPGISVGLAAGADAAWAVSLNPSGNVVTATRIDAQFDAITKRVTMKAQYGLYNEKPLPAVAVGDSAVWVGPPGWLLTRIDSRTGRISKTIDTGNVPTSIATGEGGVWAADLNANNVVRVDPASNLIVATIPVGNAPAGIAAGAGGVWVADQVDNAVVRINTATNAIRQTIPVGASPAGVAVGDGAVWVANSGDGTVSRVDPATDSVVRTITVGGSPQGIAVAAGRVWVSVQAPAPFAPAKAGGTLRVVASSDVGSMDPALAYDPYSWSLEYATCAKLVNYPDRPLPAGNQLVPEVATALPRRSADGKTYTFTIRKDFRFSPPSNAPITAETFKYTIERTLNPIMKSPAAQPPFLSDIVGERAYGAGEARHISGVSVRGDTLTIRPTDDERTILAWLATPFFCAVPTDTPIDPRGVRSVPGAGPYNVSSYTPGQGVVLKRNANYRGGRPHHFAAIDFQPNVTQARAVAEIEAGTVDYSLDGAPVAADKRLRVRYGPGSPAAKAGRQQYFVDPEASQFYLALNTSRPLFADVRMRQAVNYAIDRTALARATDWGLFAPTDQYLPASMPGSSNSHVYPLKPDLARARRLAGGRHAVAVLYVGKNITWRRHAEIIKADLKAIGITVEVKSFRSDNNALFARAAKKGAPFDIFDIGWLQDYLDPSDFLSTLLDGRLIKPTGNNDLAYFDDPAYNRKLDAAAKLTGARRYRAYAELAKAVARDSAPWAVWGEFEQQNFYSARIGCQVYSPSVVSADLAALCIRGHAR